ncbi:hypothetical protein [Massiliimalia timonensis]|uniref:hypothetical protein n=1 Tax=Massiliimalia timonensis TaxID=1987501 RepID=UPI0018A07D1B|nr:hypothetical protein [Massiliimalia timonensis]
MHQSILKAIQTLAEGHQKEIADNLYDTLIALHEETDLIIIQNRLDDLEQEFDRLLLMAGTENEIIDRRLEQISNEMMKLKKTTKQVDQSAARDRGRESKYRKVMELISEHDLELTEYSDTLVYRIIERVTVLSKEMICIRFIGGYEVTETLN